MENKSFDKNTIIKHWILSSDEDYETMIIMFNSQRFGWALFIGHLVIEKLLKALYVSLNETHPPFIPNLLKLAIDSKIDINDDLKYKLITITAFNINARYDDYKNNFSNKCTIEYTTEWIYIIKDLRTWIIEQIKKSVIL